MLVGNFSPSSFDCDCVIELWNLKDNFDHIHPHRISSDPPTIWSPQPTVYGVQGYSVQLNCTFDGLPVPNITWTSPNGSILTSQSHFMIQSSNTSTMLTISVLGLGDKGTYTCNATNSIGVSSAPIQLIVKGKLCLLSSVYCNPY